MTAEVSKTMTDGEPSPMAGSEPAERVSRLELTAVAGAPRLARHHTTTELHSWRLGPQAIETAETLVSELVTNAVKAAGLARDELSCPNPGTADGIALTLRLFTSRLVIEVSDNHAQPPVLRDAGPDAESGRGLMIVSMLSQKWDHFLLPSGGKVTYTVAGISQ